MRDEKDVRNDKPPRRGRNVSRDGANLCVSQLPSRSRGFPLSSGERAGVRGNRATFVLMAEPFPGTVKLDESPGSAGGFPRRMKWEVTNTTRSNF